MVIGEDDKSRDAGSYKCGKYVYIYKDRERRIVYDYFEAGAF